MEKPLNVTPFAASEIESSGEWFNSSPLKLSELRGKVVLLEFWTFGCINCVHTLPYVRQWYQEYKDRGFVVLGIHTPEFDYERDAANVARAIDDYKIDFPVVQDNDMETWEAYQNRYWPAQYLVDKAGMVRRIHYGEGEYIQTEKAIRQLLWEEG